MNRRIIFILCAFTFFGSGLSPVLAAHETKVSDIIRMSRAGLSDETILSYLKVNEVRLQLSAEDLAALAEAEVSEDMILALIDLGNPSSQTVPLYSSRSVYPYGPGYPGGFYLSYYYDPWYYPWGFYHDYSFGAVVHLGGHYGGGHYGGGHTSLSHTTGIHNNAGHGTSLHQATESHGGNHVAAGGHRGSAHRGSSIGSVHSGRGQRSASHGRTSGSHSGRSHSRGHSGSRQGGHSGGSHRGGGHGGGHSGGH